MKTKKSLILPILIFFAVLITTNFLYTKKAFANPNELINKSEQSLKRFLTDEDHSRLHNLMKNAKAIIIFPSLLKGGFFFGIEGGDGILLIKEDKKWTSPLFFTMGSVSFGFQIGISDAEMILTVMTERGLNTILNHRVKLGADVNISAGPVGFGAEAATTLKLADIYSFSRGRGAYAGISLEGSYIYPNKDFNSEYYGKDLDISGQSSYKELLGRETNNFNKILKGY